MNPYQNQAVQPPYAPAPSISNLTFLFLAGALLSALNCFARADYNLPLFIFCILVTGNQGLKHEVRTIYLLIFSQFVDFFYILYWGSSISAFSNENLSWLHSTYVFTIILTTIILVLKFGILYSLLGKSEDLRKQVSVPNAVQNLSEFFSSNQQLPSQYPTSSQNQNPYNSQSPSGPAYNQVNQNQIYH